MSSAGKIFLETVVKRLLYYKDLADKTFAVLNSGDFHFTPNEESNSIAVIIRHVSGNMLSRWTDFLTSDGEKEWRNRDSEFTITAATRDELIAQWEQGWNCCLEAINSLTEADLLKTVYIRNEGLSVVDAINRQLAHYPYHVGQIIYIAKIIKDNNWQSLSIPKNRSVEFNRNMKKGK